MKGTTPPMYRNLSSSALELGCGQTQLIELALSNGFGGFDIDMAEFQDTVISKGLDAAARLLKSAKVKLHCAQVPISLNADDAKFQAHLVKAVPLLQTAQELGVKYFEIPISPGCEALPYHEEFQRCCQRLVEMSEKFQPYEVGIALSFSAAVESRAAYPTPFITKADELVTLTKMVPADNVALIVDMWHWVVSGAGLELLQGLDINRIAEVRLANVPEGEDLDTISLSKRGMPAAGGQVPIAEVLTHLAQNEYKGPITPTPDRSMIGETTREGIVQAVSAAIDEAYSAAGLDKRGRVAATTN